MKQIHFRRRRRGQSARCEELEARLVLSAAAAPAVNSFVIDLLVVYTQQAKIERNGEANIQRLIQDAVDSTNQALDNSLIPITVRLVHSEQTNYVSSGNIFTDLDRLRIAGDGYLDDIAALRNQWGADLVCLISNDVGGGGAGNGPTDGNPDNDATGVTVVDANSISDSNLTLAHEIGHNLGAGHERDNTVAPADGIYPYSYGYRFVGADGVTYHDIMSYDPGLGIPYYSNPNVTYAGVPEGKAESDSASADLAKTFTLTAPMISAYRPTVVPDNSGPTGVITSVAPSGHLLTFTVQFTDDEAVDVSSVGSNDVYVSTPEGFKLGAELIGVDRTGNADRRTATYRVTLPASNPPLSFLHFMLRGGAVQDVNGNFASAGELASNRGDLAGWDFRTARDLGTLAPVQVMTDSLGEGDTDDIDKFTVSTRSVVNVSLTGLSGDADFFFVKDKNGNGLYDPTQKVDDPANEYLDGSYNTNAGDRSIAIVLDPGTYYVWTYLQTTVSTSTPYTMTIEEFTDNTPPTATLDATDLTTTGATHIDFAVTYSDDHELNGFSTLYSAALDVHVALDDGFSYDMYWYPDPSLNAPYPENAKSQTIYYRILGPDTGYTANDNGVYTLTPHVADRAADAAGNSIAATPIGSFRIAIGVADTAAPTATATLPPIVTPNALSYQFTVAYADNRGLDSGSIDGSEILVTGPNHFSQHPTLVGLGPVSSGGSTRIATYSIAPPGGSWGFEDDGPYSVTLADGKVTDLGGNATAGQALGMINVHVPYPGDANGDDAVGFADLVLVAQNYGAYGKGVGSGDFNFDGAVNFADLVLVAQRYGTSLPAPVFASAPVAGLFPGSSDSLSGMKSKEKNVSKGKALNPVFAEKPLRRAVPGKAGIKVLRKLM